MTTDTLEALRQKAQEAVAQAFGDAYDYTAVDAAVWNDGTLTVGEDSPVAEEPDRVAESINAALDAVGFNALLKECEAMRQALPWYAAKDGAWVMPSWHMTVRSC